MTVLDTILRRYRLGCREERRRAAYRRRREELMRRDVIWEQCMAARTPDRLRIVRR